MDIEKLYKRKMSLLNRIFELTDNVIFTGDLDSDVTKYTSLYKKRADIFQEIYDIDAEIKKLYVDKPIVNDEMRKVIKKILELDTEIDKKKEDFKASLSEKLKGYKQGRKTRQKFDPYSKSDYSTFESKA